MKIVLRVLWIKGLAGSPLVGRIIGHLRVLQRKVWRSPGAVAVGGVESPGEALEGLVSGRWEGSVTRFSSF